MRLVMLHQDLPQDSLRLRLADLLEVVEELQLQPQMAQHQNVRARQMVEAGPLVNH